MASKEQASSWIGMVKAKGKTGIPLENQSTLILFGAGASYGCDSCSPHNPPLTRNLLDELRTIEGSSWSRLPTSIESAFDYSTEGGFEKGMDSVIDQGYTHSDLQKDLALFLARFGIADRNHNTYVRLVRALRGRLESRKVILSTLNYDCLLDQAVADEFHRIAYRKYGIGPLIIKPHGSCNFLLNTIFSAKDFKHAGIGKFDMPVRTADPYPKSLIEEIQKSLWPPAMRLMTSEKHALHGTTWLNEIRDEWRQIADSAEIIIGIGVRPNSNDAPIWGSLARPEKKVFLVSRDPEARKWCNENGINKHFLNLHFSEAFVEIRKLASRTLV